jgi:hypothetical protein
LSILTAPPDEAVREIQRLDMHYVALREAVPGRRAVIEAVMPQSLEPRLLGAAARVMPMRQCSHGRRDVDA